MARLPRERLITLEKEIKTLYGQNSFLQIGQVVTYKTSPKGSFFYRRTLTYLVLEGIFFALFGSSIFYNIFFANPSPKTASSNLKPKKITSSIENLPPKNQSSLSPTSSPPIAGEGSIGYFYDQLTKLSNANTYAISGCLDPRGSGRHKGYDFPLPQGTPIYAVYSGVVEEIDPRWWFGVYGYESAVIIRKDIPDKDEGLFYSYGHLNFNSLAVKNGQRVEKGTFIGNIAYDHLDARKTSGATFKTSVKTCDGGTFSGMPENKYNVW